MRPGLSSCAIDQAACAEDSANMDSEGCFTILRHSTVNFPPIPEWRGVYLPESDRCCLRGMRDGMTMTLSGQGAHSIGTA